MWKPACLLRLTEGLGTPGSFLSWQSLFSYGMGGYCRQLWSPKARSGPWFQPGCLPDTESHIQSHCFPRSSQHASQQGCSQSCGIAWTLSSGAMPLFYGEKLALSTSLPPSPVLLFSPFSSCVCNTVRRLQPRACQTERSRQQAVFLRTNFSVLYLVCEWQLGTLAWCTGTLCLIRPSLLPSLIKIGWETLLGLESAQPLWLLICIPDCLWKHSTCS